MSRIRTIKPEFAHSETLASVSREARLFFIMLWTVADDEGRMKGNPQLLASLLFPYDDDAPGLVGGWIEELASIKAVAPYTVDGKAYLWIPKWKDHQKINRPTPSRLPAPPDNSVKPHDTFSEDSVRTHDDDNADRGPWTVDRGPCTKDSLREGSDTPTPPDNDEPPSEPDQTDSKANQPFQVVERVLTSAHRLANLPAPRPTDIRKWLKANSHVLAIVDWAGEADAGQLIGWCYKFKNHLTERKINENRQWLLAEARKHDFGEPPPPPPKKTASGEVDLGGYTRI